MGVHFSINRMLSFDSVKLRLDREQPLSFLEFNYMILQAYDFLELSSATAACCRWAAPTSGATSSTASISAAAATSASSMR
jgi:Golgi nucleoside diphosphatase